MSLNELNTDKLLEEVFKRRYVIEWVNQYAKKLIRIYQIVILFYQFMSAWTKNRISEEKEEIILIRYYKFVSLQRVINTTSNGKVTNGRTPEEMDDIIRHYISGAVRVFFSFMKIQN